MAASLKLQSMPLVEAIESLALLGENTCITLGIPVDKKQDDIFTFVCYVQGLEYLSTLTDLKNQTTRTRELQSGGGLNVPSFR